MENGTEEHRDEEGVEQLATEDVEDQQKQPFWSSERVLNGIIILLVLGILIALFLPMLAKSREAARMSLCQNNLRQISVAFKMYSKENRAEMYPPAVCADDIWTVDMHTLYPNFLNNPEVVICPDSKDSRVIRGMKEALERKPPDWDTLHHLMAQQYVYLPWAIIEEEIFLRLITMSHRPVNQEIEMGVSRLYHLREGVGRFLITDIGNVGASAIPATKIPIMFDNPGTTTHIPKGINVLYLDGHVEFLPLGSRFPATEAVWDYFTEKTAALKNEP